ncbi:MAG TPA: hypothetical protein VGK58_16945 [Lacipirellulaceae bacterium]
MDAALAFLYVVLGGVNYGWQPADNADDGYEYIVQVEPELLDAMRRGNAAPIESNVPAEVAPIRKVRIVVGSGELPRETVAVNRTAYFAGQPEWTPDRYGPIEPAAATRGERYPPPSLPASSQVSPPPSVLDRAQTAVTETSNTLRDGVEAGIRAANQELSRGGDELLDASREAGQEFGQELQKWTNDPARELQETGNNVRAATERTLGTVGNRLQQVTNPFVTTAPPSTTTRGAAPRGGVAPPPWEDRAAQSAPRWSDAAAGAGDAPASQSIAPVRTATRTSTGWTSIGTTVASPPLIIPSLSTTARQTDTRPAAASQAANDGPLFPEESQPRRDTIHSPLSDPAQQSAGRGAADDWSTNWGSGPSTPQVSINRAGNRPPNTAADRNSDLVAVEPAGTRQDRQTEERPASRFQDVWDNAANWGQPTQSAPAIGAAPNRTADSPANASPQGPANNPAIATAGTNGTQPASVPPVVTQPPASVQRGDEPPWLPLLLVSLSLMGSLSANLFLGWSYMDARQKYRTLVRKTADKFRRAAAA